MSMEIPNYVNAGVRKAREKKGKVKLYVDEDGTYYLVIGVSLACRDRNKLMNEIYDEVYKETQEANMMILVVDEKEIGKIEPVGKEIKIEQ